MLGLLNLGSIHAAKVRVLKVIQRFDSLHLLLGSIRASFDILAWQPGSPLLLTFCKHLARFSDLRSFTVQVCASPPYSDDGLCSGIVPIPAGLVARHEIASGSMKRHVRVRLCVTWDADASF